MYSYIGMFMDYNDEFKPSCSVICLRITSNAICSTLFLAVTTNTRWLCTYNFVWGVTMQNAWYRSIPYCGMRIAYHFYSFNSLRPTDRVTHICDSKLTSTGSVSGLSTGWFEAIIWTDAGLLWIGPLWTNFSDILIIFFLFLFVLKHTRREAWSISLMGFTKVGALQSI